MYLPTTHTSAPVQLPSSPGYTDVTQNGKVEGKAQRIGKTLTGFTIHLVHNVPVKTSTNNII
jgi:hypothetical protein